MSLRALPLQSHVVGVAEAGSRIPVAADDVHGDMPVGAAGTLAVA